MASFLFILTLLFCIFQPSITFPLSLSYGSRSLLREFNDDNKNMPEQSDFSVELNATNFDAVLGSTPAIYAIVEFFAHWCPACRNHKPHYEKVAKLFNGANASHPGILLMTKVDCALKINNNLCDKFSVIHYPMLFWGPPSKFVSGSWDPKQEKSGFRTIDNARTASRLLEWINKELGSSYGLDDQKFQNEHLKSNISDPGQIARAIYDVEEATSKAFDIIIDHKMIKSETRASFIIFFQLLVAHHPSRRCRKGSADILVNFDDFYPLDMGSSKRQSSGYASNSSLVNFQICGREVPRGYWMFCRGSINETRGFSCGLWVLLHSLTVRIDDRESNMTFLAICEFIHNFFVCEECRQHFYQMCSSVSAPFNRTRDLVLWLWSAHNKVNKRLMEAETLLGTDDPKFPKIIWPSKQLCPACRRGQRNNEDSQIDWDHDEVFSFLVNYYGKTLVTLHKDKELLGDGGINREASEDLASSGNAVVVPVGAALAIAAASCAFGALAYLWRSRQKNRKSRRGWN